LIRLREAEWHDLSFRFRPLRLRSQTRAGGRYAKCTRRRIVGNNLLKDTMNQFDPLPAGYTSTAYDGILDPQRIAETAEYVAELERLTTAIPRLRRELKNLRDTAPPSNEEIANALFTALGNAAEVSEQERLDRLRPIVERFAYSLTHVGYPRASIQAEATPALRGLYATLVTSRLRSDLAKLGRDDRKAVEHAKKIKDAETELRRTERRLEEMSAFCLGCFRDARLPQNYRGCGERSAMISRFALTANATDIQIGVCLLLEFASDWRAVQAVVGVPVSVHGTAIYSMNPERKKVWSKAFTAMALKVGDVTRNKLYAPRVEPKQSSAKVPA